MNDDEKAARDKAVERADELFLNSGREGVFRDALRFMWGARGEYERERAARNASLLEQNADD